MKQMTPVFATLQKIAKTGMLNGQPVLRVGGQVAST